MAELGAGRRRQKLLDAIRDRPPNLHDSLERVEAAVDQVAADLHAQGAAQWADLAADVAAEASDAIKGCASTLLFVISVALVAPGHRDVHGFVHLDPGDRTGWHRSSTVRLSRGCARLATHTRKRVQRYICGDAGRAVTPSREAHARVQVQAALGSLLRCIDSLKHRLTRRAVERREVNDGDVCPICHEELTDQEMGPLAFCRWGCGRAVHDECAKPPG